MYLVVYIRENYLTHEYMHLHLSVSHREGDGDTLRHEEGNE